MAIDALAHVAEQMDRLQGAIGKEATRTGVELAVQQCADVRIVLIRLGPAIADQVRDGQHFFDRRPDRYGIMFGTYRYGYFSHTAMIIFHITSNKRVGGLTGSLRRSREQIAFWGCF